MPLVARLLRAITKNVINKPAHTKSNTTITGITIIAISAVLGSSRDVIYKHNKSLKKAKKKTGFAFAVC